MKWKEARAGHFLVTPNETMLVQAIMLGFQASNNESVYEALLVELWLAKELSIKMLAMHSNSQLITNQVFLEYMAKHLRQSLGTFEGISNLHHSTSSPS